MSNFIFEATDEAGTDRFGAALAAVLPPGAVVALTGTLGAGKTRLAQAIAAASGIHRDEVVSPTFVLCQTYAGQRLIHHLDAYRVRDEDEFRELGIEELFAGQATVIIEWADKVLALLPDDHLTIEIQVTGPSSRRFVLSGPGPTAKAAIESLTTALAASTNY